MISLNILFIRRVLLWLQWHKKSGIVGGRNPPNI
jgi:hypothetical protein